VLLFLSELRTLKNFKLRTLPMSQYWLFRYFSLYSIYKYFKIVISFTLINYIKIEISLNNQHSDTGNVVTCQLKIEVKVN